MKQLDADSRRLTQLMEEDVKVYELMTGEFKDIDHQFGQPRKTRVEREDGER